MPGHESQHAEYSALRHLLSGLLLNHDPCKTWVWMMTEYIAYLDDSGHPDSEDVVIVAGWLGTEDQWLLSEGEWKRALRDAGIPLEIGFHMTDFESADCPLYSHWTRIDKDRFLFRLINLLRTRTRIFVSALVPMTEYRLANDRHAIEECLGRPYAMAGRLIGQQLREWEKNYNPRGHPVVTIFEDGSKHKGDLMDIFRRDGFDPPAFRDKKKVVPLQGADLLAWEYFNAFKTNRIRPSLDSIIEKHPGMDNIYTYEDLLDSAQRGNVPERDRRFRYFFHNLRKKTRKRTIF
jgi:hypothetical protein